jgi:hypothetical protein
VRAFAVGCDLRGGEAAHHFEAHAEACGCGWRRDAGAVVDNLEDEVGAPEPRGQGEVAVALGVGVADDIGAGFSDGQRDRHLGVVVAVTGRKRGGSVTEAGHLIRVGWDSLLNPLSSYVGSVLLAVPAPYAGLKACLPRRF